MRPRSLKQSSSTHIALQLSLIPFSLIHHGLGVTCTQTCFVSRLLQAWNWLELCGVVADRPQAGDLVDGQAGALLCLSVMWVPVTYGSQSSVATGVYTPGAPSSSARFEIWFFFIIFFHRFSYKLQKFISRATSVQMGWTKFCWIYHEVYYLIKIWNLLFMAFF